MADLSGDDGDSACGYPGDGRFRNSCFTDTAVCFHCWYLHGIGGDGVCIGLYCTFYPGCTTYFDKQCADGHPALAENTAAGCCSGGGSAGLLPVWAWDCLYPCCGSPGG